MRHNIVLFAFGVWLLQQQAELPRLEYAWGLLLFAPALVLARAHACALRYTGKVMIAVLALAAGFMWAGSMAHVRLADALPSGWEGRDIDLIGVVASLPQPAERSVRFELD